MRWFMLFMLALVGCSGSEPNGGSGEMRISVDYSIRSGEEKRYQCFTMRVPSQAPTVTKITPVYGAGVHHLVVWTPLVDEPDGAFDCSALAKPTWFPLYTGGVASTPLEMPSGAGIHLVAGQQIMVQLHLLNATSAPISDRAIVVLSTSDDEALVPAGAWGADNRVIDIPAGARGYEVAQTCRMDQDMDVFAVFGHAHRLGRSIELSRGPLAGQDVLYSAPWRFDDQPVVPLHAHVAQGEQLTIRCTYDNPGVSNVRYGERTSDEMCSFVAFYTPWAGFSGCTKQRP